MILFIILNLTFLALINIKIIMIKINKNKKHLPVFIRTNNQFGFGQKARILIA